MECICCDCSSEEYKRNAQIEKELAKHVKVMKATYTLLLLGAGEAGKSTIFKQMQILHLNGFNKEHEVYYLNNIRNNIKDAILAIIKALGTLAPEIQLEKPENNDKINWLLENAARFDCDFTPQFYSYVQDVWRDKGIQAVYERNNEYQLIDCAKYFLDKIDIVQQDNYTPTQQDILRCRILTEKINEIEFSLGKVKFRIIDVGGQRGSRGKWIQCFNKVTAIIFVTSCGSYNMTLLEDAEKNRLKESLEIFTQIWKNRFLLNISVILFMNKKDVLKEKIIAGKSKIEEYFPEYADFRLHQRIPEIVENEEGPPEYLKALLFIYTKFKQISDPTRIVQIRPGVTLEHYLYPHFTCAVDTENIKRVFNSCTKIIQRLHLKQMGLL